MANIHPTSIIYPGVTIHPDAVIGPYCVIGHPPEHRDFYDGSKETCGVVIDKGARIYEFVTIHAGTHRPTFVGENACIFNHTHLAHDVEVHRGATIGGHCTLAGHTVVMDCAVVSGGARIHQHSVVGAYAFIGLGGVLRGFVPNGEKWIGSPSRPVGFNEVGLARANLTMDMIYEIYHEAFLFNKEKSKL